MLFCAGFWCNTSATISFSDLPCAFTLHLLYSMMDGVYNMWETEDICQICSPKYDKFSLILQSRLYKTKPWKCYQADYDRYEASRDNDNSST